jgi:hypothetical protein
MENGAQEKNKKEIESGRQVPKTEANPLHQPKAPKMHPRLLEGQAAPSHLAARSVRGSPTSPSVAPRQSPCADVASGGPRQSPCPGGVVTNPAGATSTPVRVVAQTLPSPDQAATRSSHLCLARVPVRDVLAATRSLGRLYRCAGLRKTPGARQSWQSCSDLVVVPRRAPSCSVLLPSGWVTREVQVARATR